MKILDVRLRTGLACCALVLAVTSTLLLSCVPVRAQEWKPAPAPLATRWAGEVSPTNALPEYPRPQLTRPKWLSLNGLWSYGLSDAGATSTPAALHGKILVPFPYESSLSGVGKPSIPDQKLWYRRTFSIPAEWSGQRVLLHFGAVNYESNVWINGKNLGSHTGNFDEFSFDITDALRDGDNELVVSAVNAVNDGDQVMGKQRVKPGGIFYTAATGIWQSVWLEPVPAVRIAGLLITPDVDASQVRLTVQCGSDLPVRATVSSGGRAVADATGQTNEEFIIALPNARLWSPDAPFLYDLKVELGNGDNSDVVNSYFAMRKIALGKDEQGRTRIFLNNKFVFQAGVLDQGYWPDGIYTAPTDAALRSDIESAKRLGFNLLRKHAKVEPARWYYHADQLGVLVWQDMPQMFGGSAAARVQWEKEWREIIAEHINSPSIIVWTPFNEGWGQFDTERIAALTKTLDPSRLVNSASGWTDKGAGDIVDKHQYPDPAPPAPEANRAGVIGEFGGITLNLGHRWNDEVAGHGATLTSNWTATKRYQQLILNIYTMKSNPGISAFVYTQLTDVEQEINGVLTYDRAVVKMDERIVAAANRGEFLPLGPNPDSKPALVPTSEGNGTIKSGGK
jgi:beta-galactosidase/beta-glucuronidase